MPKIYALVYVFFGDFEVHEKTVAVSFSEEELKLFYEQRYSRDTFSASIEVLDEPPVYRTVEFQVPFANNQEEIDEFENEDKPYYCVRPIDFVE